MCYAYPLERVTKLMPIPLTMSLIVKTVLIVNTIEKKRESCIANVVHEIPQQIKSEITYQKILETVFGCYAMNNSLIPISIFHGD